MTLPIAHLVYDGTSKHLVRYEDHLVYVRLLNHCESNGLQKFDSSSVSLEDAVTKMKEKPWGSGSSEIDGQAGIYNYYDVQWMVQSSCLRVDCSTLDPNVKGEVALKVRVCVTSGEYSVLPPYWRIGWRTSDDGTFDNNWSWLDTAPSITVTSDGRHTLATDVTLMKYFFVFVSLAAYQDPGSGNRWGYYVVEPITRYSGISFEF